MHLIVLDLDGTLVDSAEFNARLYVQAVRTVLGIEIDDNWSGYRHVTDSGILEEIVDNAKVKTDRFPVHAEVKEAFVRMVADYIDDRGGLLREISGARAFVDKLTSHPQASVAIATGGWKETAMMKLRAIGLDPEELCLATASDAVSRVEIMRIIVASLTIIGFVAAVLAFPARATVAFGGLRAWLMPTFDWVFMGAGKMVSR